MSVKVEIVKAPKVHQPPDEIVIRVSRNHYATLTHLFRCWNAQGACTSLGDARDLAYEIANALDRANGAAGV